MKYQNIVLVLAYSAVSAVAQDDAEGSENPCVAQRTGACSVALHFVLPDGR